MTSFTLYLLYLVGSLNIAFKSVFIIAIVGSGILGIACTFPFDTEGRISFNKTAKKALKIIITALSMSLAGWILCPSTEQLAVIYLLPKMSNSKLVKTLPAYAQTFLDLEIKKLKKETMEVSK